jgi:hypothetical protein
MTSPPRPNPSHPRPSPKPAAPDDGPHAAKTETKMACPPLSKPEMACIDKFFNMIFLIEQSIFILKVFKFNGHGAYDGMSFL